MPEEIEKENLLGRRLNKILENRLENDQETLEAIKELSTFFSENTLPSRRNLRSEIEKRSLTINENFLSAFREVKDALDDVYNDVAAMSESVKEMTTRLQNTKIQTKSLIEQTTCYQKESMKLSMQERVVEAFIDKFQLNPDEVNALYGKTRDAPVTFDLFTVLDKVQQIHLDCKILMQSGHQTIALDIMEQMTLHQEGALERLYRWAQSHCRYVDSPDVTSLVTQAMARLQDRPVLFKYVIDEYCTARRAVLVGAFIDALTRGGTSAKPMEHYAHDPQRYVGDMLAWLNQNLPVEKENLFILVKLCDKIDVSEHLSQALANISEGVCHPLKIRVEKMLTVPAPSTTLYAVTNLIRFYKNSIGQIIKGGSLEYTLNDLQDKSEMAFLSALQVQVNNALIHVEAPPRDLSPTPAIQHLLLVLKEVLSTAASMVEGKQKDMDKIASCILDPLLRAVNEQAARLPPTDMAVYMLNCLHAMHSCLEVYQFMVERLERLQAQSDAQIDTLTSEQASSLVANLNLGPIYTILQDKDKGPLSSIPGMEPTNLKNFLDRLDTVAANPDLVMLPQINLLLSAEHKNAVQTRAFQVLIAIYKQLYEGIYNPSNHYHNPELILNKTPEDLKNMFNL